MLISDICFMSSLARWSATTRSKRWIAVWKSLFAIDSSPLVKSKCFLLPGMMSTTCRASAGCFASVPPTLISSSISL